MQAARATAGTHNLNQNEQSSKLRLNQMRQKPFIKNDQKSQRQLHVSERIRGNEIYEMIFNEPTPSLDRFDNLELRERIKSLTADEAKNPGIDKSSLYTLREHVRREQPFVLYNKTLSKLRPSNP